MKPLHLLLSLIIAVVATGCASLPSTTEPMPLCLRSVVTDAIEASQLRSALVKAQAFSNQRYGEDCYVCAELQRFEEGEIELHIRSPLPDSWVGTSATIRVRAADGKILDKTLYHSCSDRVSAG